MGEWETGDRNIAVAGRNDLGGVLGIEHQIAVREHHALRPAGGAGRVEDHRDVVFGPVDDPRVRLRGVDQRLERERPFGHRIAEHDHLRCALHVLGRFDDVRMELRAGDYDGGAGVGEDVPDLGDGQ